MSDNVRRFADTARHFCGLVEGGQPTADELAMAMATLHVAALQLPDVEAEAGHPEPSSPPALKGLELPIDIYWDVFDPFPTPPEEPCAGSFYDDVGDIRRDLRRGLELYDKGFPLAACWEWRFHFRIHWGEHLVGAQRALFLAMQ